MKYTKEYLQDLLSNPKEFKAETIRSYGYVMHKMYDNGIVIPLTLLADKRVISELSIALSKKNSHKYDPSEFKDYWKKVHSMRVSRTTFKDFTKERFVKDHLSFLDGKVVYEELKSKNVDEITSIEQFFQYLEKWNTIKNNSDLRDVQKLYEQALKDFPKSHFTRNNIQETIELIIKNKDIIKNLDSDYQEFGIEKIITRVVENSDYQNIPEEVMEVTSLAQILSSMGQNEDGKNFVKAALDVKRARDDKLVFLGFNPENIEMLKVLDWDVSKQEDREFLFSCVSFMDYKIYRTENFREIIKKSFLTKLLTMEEINKKYSNSLKRVAEFSSNSLWGDEMLDVLKKKLEHNKTKYWSASEFYDWLESGRGYSDKFVEDVLIPNEFLEKAYPFLKNNWRNSNHYYRNSDVYDHQLNVFLQYFDFQINKRIEMFKSEDVSKDEAFEQLEEMIDFMGNIGHKDSVFRSREMNQVAKYLERAIPIEIKVYEYTRLVLEKFGDQLSYKEAMKFQQEGKKTVRELHFGIASALVQNIKKPSSLWMLHELLNDSSSNGYGYTGYSVNKLEEINIPISVSLKPMFDLSQETKDEILERKVWSKIKDNSDYQSARQNILAVDYDKLYLFKEAIRNLLEKKQVDNTSDIEFSKLLNAVEHFTSRTLEHSDLKPWLDEKIAELRTQLRETSKELPSDYFYSVDYLFDNFSEELLFTNINKNENILNEMLEKYGDKIDLGIINEIIKITYNEHHEERNYWKNINSELLTKASKDIIYHFVSKNPANFEEYKEYLITGPTPELYQDFFVADKSNLLDMLIAETDEEKFKDLYASININDIEENFGKILSSENILLIKFLKESIPGSKFVDFFSKCKYDEQKVVFQDKELFEKTTSGKYSSHNDKVYMYNPENLEQFVEIFDKLREKDRIHFLTKDGYSDEDTSYNAAQVRWEDSHKLRQINIPDGDDVINYLINELPLSFLSSYELGVKGSYLGCLPRALTVDEFVQVYKFSYEKFGGAINLLGGANDSVDIYSSLFEHIKDREEKTLEMSEANLNKYLGVLEKLKETPALYYEMISLSSNAISSFLSIALDIKKINEEDEDTWSNKNKKMVWKNVENYPLLNEIKNVFEMKFNFIENINLRNNCSISNSELEQKFLSLFMDRNVFLEGWAETKAKFFADPSAKLKVFEIVSNKHMNPFLYSYYNPMDDDIYESSFKGDDLVKISEELVANDPSMAFNYYLPLFRVSKQEFLNETRKNKNAVKARDLTDEDYKLANSQARELVIKKLINEDNLWPILFSSNFSFKSYNNLEDDDKEFILEEVLNKTENRIEVLKSLSECLEFISFSKENYQDINTNYSFAGVISKMHDSIFGYLENNDIKHLKIMIENLIMEEDVANVQSSTKNRTNKF